MEADLEVSGESTLGSLGAGDQLPPSRGQDRLDLPLETGLPNLSRLSSSSSDLKLDPSEPRVISGSVRPSTVDSFEAEADGEARSAVRDVGAILYFG